MTEDLIFGLGLVAVGLFLAWRARLVRDGSDRRWIETYRNTSLSWWLRNGALSLPFLAGACILFGLGGLIRFGVTPRALGSIISGLPLALGLVLALIGVVVAYRAPSWVKPEWLRDSELETPGNKQRTRVAWLLDFLVIAIPVGALVVAVLALVVLAAATLLRG